MTEVISAVNETAKVFTSLGAKIEKVEMDFLREAAIANSLITQADGAAYHRERLAEHPGWFGADVRRTFGIRTQFYVNGIFAGTPHTSRDEPSFRPVL